MGGIQSLKLIIDGEKTCIHDSLSAQAGLVDRHQYKTYRYILMVVKSKVKTQGGMKTSSPS